MAFAVIQTGGKQYRVSPKDKIKIEKLAHEKRASAQGPRQHESAHTNGGVVFDKVLLIADGEEVKIGEPYIHGAKVEGKILRQGRERKKIVFKYHSKTRYRKKKGHRQYFTEVLITKV